MTFDHFDQLCQQLNLAYRIQLHDDATYHISVASGRHYKATRTYQLEASSRALSDALARSWALVCERCPKARSVM